MRKTLTLIVLLFTSQFAYANIVTDKELICVAKSVYYEARGTNARWYLKIANVAYNRKLHFNKHTFGSKSKDLCDIVSSAEYKTNTLLRNREKDIQTYNAIVEVLKTRNWYNIHDFLYFNATKHKLTLRKHYVKNTSHRH